MVENQRFSLNWDILCSTNSGSPDLGSRSPTSPNSLFYILRCQFPLFKSVILIISYYQSQQILTIRLHLLSITHSIVYYHRIPMFTTYFHILSSIQWQRHKRITLSENISTDEMRLSNLDVAFANKCNKETEWPFSLSNPKDLFRQFRQTLHSLSHNIICGCCACVFHNPTTVRSVSLDYLDVDRTTLRATLCG